MKLSIGLYVASQRVQGMVADAFREIAGEPQTLDERADERNHGLQIISTERSVIHGALDSSFWVGVAVSVPVGVGASLIANWLSEKLKKARELEPKAAITLRIEQRVLTLTGTSDLASPEVVAAIAKSLGSDNDGDQTPGSQTEHQQPISSASSRRP
jgi:hypothetical protein